MPRFIFVMTLMLLLCSENVRAGPSPGCEQCEAEIRPDPWVEQLADVSAVLDEASTAARNAQLVKTAKWKFGRDQVGFEIYIPLIQNTIGTTEGHSEPGFARALAEWQKKQGYRKPDGVLDVSAFLFLKEYWQAERKLGSASSEKTMVRISRSDLYDPRREEALSQVGEKTYRAYTRMIAAARRDGVTGADLKIIASNRSQERLEMLKKAVSPTEVGTAIAGKKSVHFTGRALDLHVSGKPVDSSDENRMKQSRSKAYLWLLKNASKYGFRNYFYEPWHWEYVGSSE